MIQENSILENSVPIKAFRMLNYPIFFFKSSHFHILKICKGITTTVIDVKDAVTSTSG